MDLKNFSKKALKGAVRLSLSTVGLLGKYAIEFLVSSFLPTWIASGALKAGWGYSLPVWDAAWVVYMAGLVFRYFRAPRNKHQHQEIQLVPLSFPGLGLDELAKQDEAADVAKATPYL
jgi:hypothetical protein